MLQVRVLRFTAETCPSDVVGKHFVGKYDAAFMLLFYLYIYLFCCCILFLYVLPKGMKHTVVIFSPSPRRRREREKRERALHAGPHLSSRRRWRHAAGRLVLLRAAVSPRARKTSGTDTRECLSRPQQTLLVRYLPLPYLFIHVFVYLLTQLLLILDLHQL